MSEIPPATTPSSRPGASRGRAGPGGAVALAGALLAALAVGARRMGDPDLGWHLAIGRQMVEIGGLPRVDDLTYSLRGTPCASEYLGELLLWAALRLGGPAGLQALAVACAGAIALLVRRRAGGPAVVGWALAALALMASENFLVVRPALLSLALLAAAMALLDAQRVGGGRAAWLLPPLLLAWSAIHTFATVAAVIAVGYAGHAVACRLARGRMGGWLPARDGASAGTLSVVAGAGLVATCLGPIGPRIFATPWKAVEYAGFLTEWAPVSLRFVALHAPAFGVLAALALAALLVGRGDERPSLLEVALVLGSLALALARMRLVPVFAIVAAPVVARRLGAALAAARGGPALLLCTSLAAAPVIALSPGSHLGLGFDEQRLPEGAVRFLAAHHPRGPLWNFLSFGGWIEHRLHPEVRAFIDGRTGYLVPFAFFRDYAEAEHDAAAFARLERRWGFQWAVVPAGPLDRFSEPIAADPRWVMVHLDDVAAVYVLADGLDGALAERGYRLLRHLTPVVALLDAPPAQRQVLAADAARALGDQPDSPRAHLLVAAAALALGDLGAAARERDLAEALDPRHPGLSDLDARLGSVARGR